MQFLSAQQIAAVYGVPYYRVREAILVGDLQAMKLGPAYAVSEVDAKAWVAQYEAKHDPAQNGRLQAQIAKLEAELTALRAQEVA